MRVEKRDGSQERQIVLALLVNDRVLGRVSAKWQRDLFRSRWANLVATWCVQYYRKYERAPRKDIERVFETWSQKPNADANTVELVQRFLESLSREYEQLDETINPEFMIELAGKHFDLVRLQQAVDALQGDVESGDADAAFGRISQLRRSELALGSGLDMLQDKEAIRQAFESKQEPLIVYPGALGEFYGSTLERDGFIAFEASEKKGKSWTLLDVAWRALLQRRKVAFFEVGDMSQNQILRRFMVRVAKAPMKPQVVRYPRTIHVDPETGGAEVTWEEKEFRKPLQWQQAWRACERVMKSQVKSGESYFKLSCHPNSSVNVEGIKSILDLWEQEGWLADVVLVDYADILAPPAGSYKLESRDQINVTWKQLRALSQERHCLVVTATQAKASSYEAHTLTMKHFGEDKRKRAHVTGSVGINQVPSEKAMGVIRYKWIAGRELDPVQEARPVYVAGCLALGNPCVKSCF